MFSMMYTDPLLQAMLRSHHAETDWEQQTWGCMLQGAPGAGV